METAERQQTAKEEKGQEVSSQLPDGVLLHSPTHTSGISTKKILKMLLSSKPSGYDLCYGWIQETLASPSFRNKTEFPTLCSDPKCYGSRAKHT